MRTMTPAVSRIARYELSPAESSYADRDESRDDLSIEKSFESAIDESLVSRISEAFNWKMVPVKCLFYSYSLFLATIPWFPPTPILSLPNLHPLSLSSQFLVTPQVTVH